jgi:uncharacterized protein YqjF (DUF2071 family)
MRWADAAFLHWRVRPGDIAPLLPDGLEVDLLEGHAWVSAVAFAMERTRLAGVPLARVRFPELNLRTYVTHRGEPGIRFLAIDAAGPFVPLGRWQGMPYRKAHVRLHRGDIRSEPRVGQAFEASWQATGGSLDERRVRFLVERYTVFGSRRRKLTRNDVVHRPWPLGLGMAQVKAWGSLPAAARGRQPDLVHLSPGVDVVAGRALLA